jgi:hypothetical protein
VLKVQCSLQLVPTQVSHYTTAVHILRCLAQQATVQRAVSTTVLLAGDCACQQSSVRCLAALHLTLRLALAHSQEC